MTDMVAVIAGTEYVYYDSVEAELDDFLPVKSIVFIPGYPDGTIPPDSEAVVKKWMDFADQDYFEAEPEMLMEQAIECEPEAEHVLIVLGKTDPAMVNFAISLGWSVHDLTLGLFPVTQSDDGGAEMPLDGPEVNADGLAYESGVTTPDTSSPWYDPSEGLTREEIEKIVAGYIKVHEAAFHQPSVATGTVAAMDHMREVFENASAEEVATIKCYKNKSGKIRKAGRSKMKPGEEEIWLEQADVDAL